MATADCSLRSSSHNRKQRRGQYRLPPSLNNDVLFCAEFRASHAIHDLSMHSDDSDSLRRPHRRSHSPSTNEEPKREISCTSSTTTAPNTITSGTPQVPHEGDDGKNKTNQNNTHVTAHNHEYSRSRSRSSSRSSRSSSRSTSSSSSGSSSDSGSESDSSDYTSDSDWSSLEDDSDDELDDEDEDEEDRTWIEKFISRRGNEFFCEVDEEFINEAFNLYGLSSVVQYYKEALDIIVSAPTLASATPIQSQSPENSATRMLIKSSAELLFGLIHARFVVTSKGLQLMHEKYLNGDFGSCPRVLCNGAPLLPVGLTDMPSQHCVKMYCIHCGECYNPSWRRHTYIDGAFFGTTFAHLMVMQYEDLRALQGCSAQHTYIPKVFGFKLRNWTQAHHSTTTTHTLDPNSTPAQQHKPQPPNTQQNSQP